jgi:lysophospholipase L1-like esterase
MNKLFAAVIFAIGLLCTAANAQKLSPNASNDSPAQRWVGTWATASQHFVPGEIETFQNQTLRLIVHTSVAGTKVRVRISNTFADQPLLIGRVHIAHRTSGADVDPASDRALTFAGLASTKLAAGSIAISDPVDLDVPALSDLAISVFLPESTKAATSHVLALQTSYVSDTNGDVSGAASFPKPKPIDTWPLLTGVDVAASPPGATIVALGSSLTDGDGSTKDANRRWPDVLAERLQKAKGRAAELGVLNEGIIGNRLLSDTDSPKQAGGPPPLGEVFTQLGPALGQSGLQRFDRDVLAQAGVKYVIVALGVNDILFPGSFIPASESVSTQSLTSGYRQLIDRAHKKGVRVIGSTIPPFEHALFRNPFFGDFYTPEKERVRQEVNVWIRNSGAFDGVIDFDQAVRDPSHPTQVLPAYDSGDHLHVNDAGNAAQVNVISLALFETD